MIELQKDNIHRQFIDSKKTSYIPQKWNMIPTVAGLCTCVREK